MYRLKTSRAVSPHPVRRLRCMASGLALGLAVSLASLAAQAGTTTSTVTSLTSLSQRMISYRHQEHSWQTADGGIHVLINHTKQSGNNSLTLYSSHDAGATWQQQQVLNGTGASNVSDGYYDSATSSLSVIYDTVGGDIRFVTFPYDSSKRSFAAGAIQTLPRGSATTSGANPSFVTDTKGNTWAAFVETDSADGKSVIVLHLRKPGKTKWNNTGLQFGPKDATAPAPQVKRSARLVLTPAGVGMVFTVHETMYWSERPVKGDAGTPWSAAQTLYTSPNPPDSEPVSSHFNTALDGKGYIHLAFADGGALMYMRYDAKSLAWSPYATLVPASAGAQITYPQMVWQGNQNIAIISNYGEMARIYQATDRGTSAAAGDTGDFACTDRFQHTPTSQTGGLQDYTLPRLEAPSNASLFQPVPVFQQFIDYTNGYAQQRALFNSFSQSGTPGCKN